MFAKVCLDDQYTHFIKCNPVKTEMLHCKAAANVVVVWNWYIVVFVADVWLLLDSGCWQHLETGKQRNLRN